MGAFLDSAEEIRHRKKNTSWKAHEDKEKLEKDKDKGITMAKKEEKPKTVIERTYNIPLRREWLKAPRWKRTKKAVKAAREFLQKHMKSENIKLGKHLNESIWKHGGKNPPHHVKVNVTKDEEGTVIAELVGAPKEEVKAQKPVKKEEKVEGKKEEVKEEKKEKVEEAKEKVVEEKKKEKPKKEEKAVEKKEEPKKPKPVEKPKEEKPAEKKPEQDTSKIAEFAKEIMKKGSLRK
jgi:large subunit ribosomal protein L31e